MKILFVITKGAWGGATRYVHDLAIGMSESGHEVHVAYGTQGPLDQKLQTKNIYLHHVKGLDRDISFLKDIQAFFEISSIISKVKPDVLHINSSKAAALAAVAGRVHRVKKIIFTAHGFAFTERRGVLSKYIFKCIYFVIMFLSHRTIAVSKFIAQQVNDWPLVKKKIVHIPLGIHEELYLSKQDARKHISQLIKGVNIDEESTMLLTIAELHDNKGIDTALSGIVSARRYLPENFKYVVIGEGEERWKLESLIESYDLSKHVYLVGFLEDAAKYMRAADIFILPSRTEALGYVLLEAALGKVPVIATRVGGIPEIIKHNKTGILIPPESPTVLAEGIKKLLQEKSFAQRMSEELFDYSKDSYSIQNLIQTTEKVYLT